VVEVMRRRPDFSVAVYTSHESFKLKADREHLASSLRKARLPEYPRAQRRGRQSLLLAQRRRRDPHSATAASDARADLQAGVPE
jgi:hypothetical protein